MYNVRKHEAAYLPASNVDPTTPKCCTFPGTATRELKLKREFLNQRLRGRRRVRASSRRLRELSRTRRVVYDPNDIRYNYDGTRLAPDGRVICCGTRVIFLSFYSFFGPSFGPPDLW